MDIIYDTLKNITGYIILVSVVSNLLSGSTYKKYIRFFSGLVIIALFINPISKLLNGENDIFKNIKLLDLNSRFDEYEQNIQLYEEKDYEIVYEEYNKISGEIINEILYKHDLILDDYKVEPDMNTGKPSYVYVSAFMTENLSSKDVVIDNDGNVNNKSLKKRADNLEADICNSFGVTSDIVEIYVGP